MGAIEQVLKTTCKNIGIADFFYQPVKRTKEMPVPRAEYEFEDEKIEKVTNRFIQKEAPAKGKTKVLMPKYNITTTIRVSFIWNSYDEAEKSKQDFLKSLPTSVSDSDGHSITISPTATVRAGYSKGESIVPNVDVYDVGIRINFHSVLYSEEEQQQIKRVDIDFNSFEPQES